MARERYYVGQYGYFWSFSRDELIAFFREAIENGGYELPPCKTITRPKGIYSNRDGGGYWSALVGPSGRYFEPLDWDAEAFKDALESMGANDAAA